MRATKYLLGLFLLRLTVLNAQEYATEMTVAQDGSGDYITIQDAIDDAKSFPDERITIFIRPGIYKEKVTVNAWNTKITLKGEDAMTTVITWDDYFGKMGMGRNSTFYTATVTVLAEEFQAQDITFENSAGEVGQAVAIVVDADRCQFWNCRFIGNQDTLYANGRNARQYYVDCYIEGTTDFIFGGATALFENCHIRCKKTSYITAASTPQGRDFGYVFQHCTVTADPDVDMVYLGRPWRDYANVVFLNCTLGSHIRPEGWHNWSKPEREKTAWYAEYRNTGPGADTVARVPWSHQLTRKQAKVYTKKNILASFTLPAFILINE